MPYPILVHPSTVGFAYAGTFNPATPLPVLVHGSGTEGEYRVVTQEGRYNFATGQAGNPASPNLLPGDLVAYQGGAWEIWPRGIGDFLRRDGVLPMLGPLELDGQPLRLGGGLLQGTDDGTPGALVAGLILPGGGFLAPANSIRLRGRETGDPPGPPSYGAPYELAIDTAPAGGGPPLLYLGMPPAGAPTVLVGPTRQMELTGDQVALGTKTIRRLIIGDAGQEIALPTSRGAAGDFIRLSGTGDALEFDPPNLALTTDVITIPGTGAVEDDFNLQGPFTVTLNELVFVAHKQQTWLFNPPPGNYGQGGTPATAGMFQGPVVASDNLPFASVAEALAGTAGRVLGAPEAGTTYLQKRDGGPAQIVRSDVQVQSPGAILVQASAALSVDGVLNVTGRATIQALPRSDGSGTADAVNRSALDARFAPTAASTGAGQAGKAPIHGVDGKLDRLALPAVQLVDWRGPFNPTAPAGQAPRNTAGGGLTPAARGGELLTIAASGNWNFTTGSAGGGIALAPGNLLLFDGSTWQRQDTGGGGGGFAGGADLAMGGYAITFTAGGRITGASAVDPLELEFVALDGGTF